MDETPESDAGDKYLKEIAELTQLVESGYDLVEQGNQIDMTNLEEPIADLCRRLTLVPPNDPDAVSAAIQHLVRRLGELSQALQAQSKPSN